MATDDKVSVIVTSTDTSGAVKQKSFTYISPEATNSELKAFAQAANALTENTYNGSKKVTQVDLDTATGKQTPTFTLDKTTDTKANVCAGQNGFVCYTITYTYDGDGQIFVYTDENAGSLGVAQYRPMNQLNICSIFSPAQTASGITQNAVITFRTTETDTYKAAEATFTITV